VAPHHNHAIIPRVNAGEVVNLYLLALEVMFNTGLQSVSQMDFKPTGHL